MNNNFNGGFNQGQGQGNFQPNGNFNPSNNQSGDGAGKTAFSHVKMQVVANLVNDPESKPVGNNGAKVATASVAINHRGQNAATDYWNIEVWVNQGSAASTHDFLVDHCKSGRQLFIEGIPHLKRRKRQVNGQDVLDQNGKPVYDFYPTIRVSSLMGLGGGNRGAANSNGGQQQQGQQQQAQQPQGGFGGQPQGGFGQQPQGGFNQPQGGFGAQGFQQPPQGGSFGAPAGAPGNGQAFGAPAGQFS